MIPTQEEADLNNPEEHFVWALRNLPAFAGTGMVTHPGFLRSWSKHLWECGFVHHDYLVRLADADGNINISQLPRQDIKWQPAMRGPYNVYNNAARWVGTDTPDPEPVRLPDIRELTIQENAVMIQQYRDAGMIPDNTPKRDTATELTR